VLTCWLCRNTGVTTPAITVAMSQNHAPKHAAAASLATMTLVRRGTARNVAVAVC
jgi:hypothetical protein